MDFASSRMGEQHIRPVTGVHQISFAGGHHNPLLTRSCQVYSLVEIMDQECQLSQPRALFSA